jgi:hypothetical protein
MKDISAQILGLFSIGACLLAQGCVVAAEPDEPSESLGSIEQAIVPFPSFITTYNWNASSDTGVTKTMISDQEGFCAMTKIGGRFRSTSDFVGVWQSGGHFTLSGTTNQAGNAVSGTARCVPISVFSTNSWGYSGVFFTAHTSSAQNLTGALQMNGWDAADSACWINGSEGTLDQGRGCSLRPRAPGLGFSS